MVPGGPCSGAPARYAPPLMYDHHITLMALPPSLAPNTRGGDFHLILGDNHHHHHPLPHCKYERKVLVSFSMTTGTTPLSIAANMSRGVLVSFSMTTGPTPLSLCSQ